jgi:adenylyl- and sulfurtransferase ThiI
MSKANYTLSLEKEDVEDLREWLKQQGISFSAYMQFIIREAVVTAKKIESQGLTPIMTASGLLKAASKLAEDMEADAIQARKAVKDAKYRQRK